MAALRWRKSAVCFTRSDANYSVVDVSFATRAAGFRMFLVYFPVFYSLSFYTSWISMDFTYSCDVIVCVYVGVIC